MSETSEYYGNRNGMAVTNGKEKNDRLMKEKFYKQIDALQRHIHEAESI
jgi:hypothetical protein